MTAETHQPVILIVDDTLVLRTLLSHQLRADGWRHVHVAKDGFDAIELARTLQPDIILLDIVMPGMQGTEALHALRHEHPKALIFMLSSLSEVTIARNCRDLGANGFIFKANQGTANVVSQRVREAWQRLHAPDGTAADVAS